MTKTFTEWLSRHSRQKKFKCWMLSFGIGQVPAIPKIGVKKKGCGFEDKQENNAALSLAIKEKLRQGIKDRMQVYKELLNEGDIPIDAGGAMTYPAFSYHFDRMQRNYKKFKPIDKEEILPDTQTGKILQLFDSGISEKDIVEKHGFNRRHTYCVLIRYERIERRTHTDSINSDSLKRKIINEMIVSGVDRKQIAKQTNSSIKYIDKLRCFRKKAFQYITRGQAKNANELSYLLQCSMVHAEELIKEFKELKNTMEAAA